MQKRNVINSSSLSDLRKKRRKSFLTKILFSIICFLILFFCAVYLSRLPRLNIADVEISGNKVLDSDVLSSTVRQEISGRYLWLFPKANVFFYPENGIKKALTSEFKRIDTVTLALSNSRILTVTITERTPLYVWCGTVLPSDATTNETCYFLDQDGYIFDQAPYFSGQAYFKFYGGTPFGVDGTPSGNYFDQNDFNNLISFKNTLTNMSLSPAAIYLEDDGDTEMLLSPAAGNSTPPKILFEQNADYETMTENLQAALNTDPLKSEFQNKYSSLQYIDLRFGNKVYYKFQ